MFEVGQNKKIYTLTVWVFIETKSVLIWHVEGCEILIFKADGLDSYAKWIQLSLDLINPHMGWRELCIVISSWLCLNKSSFEMKGLVFTKAEFTNSFIEYLCFMVIYTFFQMVVGTFIYFPLKYFLATCKQSWEKKQIWKKN